MERRVRGGGRTGKGGKERGGDWRMEREGRGEEMRGRENLRFKMSAYGPVCNLKVLIKNYIKAPSGQQCKIITTTT